MTASPFRPCFILLFPASESTPTFGDSPSGAALSAAQISSWLPRAASEQESNEGPPEEPLNAGNKNSMTVGKVYLHVRLADSVQSVRHVRSGKYD